MGCPTTHSGASTTTACRVWRSGRSATNSRTRVRWPASAGREERGVATSAAHPDAPPAVGAAHVLALSVAQYVLAFGASAIVARALGPEGRGHYYLPLLASTTAIAFGKLGV